MSVHTSAEHISAYLDEELGEVEANAVEEHLADCTECRRTLAGMRRVVVGLRTLERAAPPSVLAQQVQRRVTLASAPGGLLERIEVRLSRLQGIQPGVGLGFALVIALAAILYLFSVALDRHREAPLSLIIPPVVEREEAEVQVAGRSFVFDGEQWREQSLTTEPAPTPRVVEMRSEEGRSILEQEPWIVELPSEGAGVVLWLEGEVIELVRESEALTED